MDLVRCFTPSNHFFFGARRMQTHSERNETKWVKRTEHDGICCCLYCSHKKRQLLAYKSNLCFTKCHLWEYKWPMTISFPRSVHNVHSQRDSMCENEQVNWFPSDFIFIEHWVSVCVMACQVLGIRNSNENERTDDGFYLWFMTTSYGNFSMHSNQCFLSTSYRASIECRILN